MEKQTIEMKKEKVTKNTTRYAEEVTEGNPPVLRTLYLQKWIGEPEKIRITIEEAS